MGIIDMVCLHLLLKYFCYGFPSPVCPLKRCGGPKFDSVLPQRLCNRGSKVIILILACFKQIARCCAGQRSTQNAFFALFLSGLQRAKGILMPVCPKILQKHHVLMPISW